METPASSNEVPPEAIQRARDLATLDGFLLAVSLATAALTYHSADWSFFVDNPSDLNEQHQALLTDILAGELDVPRPDDDLSEAWKVDRATQWLSTLKRDRAVETARALLRARLPVRIGGQQ